MKYKKGLHCMWSNSVHNKDKISGVVVTAEKTLIEVKCPQNKSMKAEEVKKNDIELEQHKVGELVQCRQRLYSDAHDEITSGMPTTQAYWYKGTIKEIVPGKDRQALPSYVVQSELTEHGEVILNAEDVRKTWWEQFETQLISDGPSGPTLPVKNAIAEEKREREEPARALEGKRRNDPAALKRKREGQALDDLMEVAPATPLFRDDDNDTPASKKSMVCRLVLGGKKLSTTIRGKHIDCHHIYITFTPPRLRHHIFTPHFYATTFLRHIFTSHVRSVRLCLSVRTWPLRG